MGLLPFPERLSRLFGVTAGVSSLVVMLAMIIPLLTATTNLGPLSGHMSAHIVLMNVLAPLLALTILMRTGGKKELPFGGFACGRYNTSADHPLGCARARRVEQRSERSSVTLGAPMPFVCTALCFWWAILVQRVRRPWQTCVSSTAWRFGAAEFI
jgi:hypothetical protein